MTERNTKGQFVKGHENISAGRPAVAGDATLRRMQAVLDFVKQYRKEHDYAPTLKEISKAVYGNPNNFGNVQQMVQALIAQGFLVNAGKGRGRTLNVAKRPPRRFFYNPKE
jgi:SOS-response transcriptional repressor LexA